MSILLLERERYIADEACKRERDVMIDFEKIKKCSTDINKS